MSSHRERRRRMLRSDRLRTIADLARESGSIRVSDLSDRLGVTEVTIRRDLARLAEAGVVRREHGGAVALRGVESQYALRAGEEQEAKRAIARCAAELVADGATIVIDSGSTTAEFARELVHKQNLRVVTNAITTAAEVAENPDATIILTGGVFRRSTRGTVGDIAVRTLSALRADQAFIAAAGVAVDGLSYPALEEVSVKQAMIASAAEVILLADHSKFDQVSLALFADLGAIDRFVTSAPPEGTLALALEEAGVEVIVAGAEAAAGEREIA
jgi:DeoR/GlpR family transcriptional regulator of sugar metabolism